MDIDDLKTKTALVKYSQNSEAILQLILGAGPDDSAGSTPGSPSAFTVEIRDVHEKAYQRALWLAGRSYFKNLPIDWVDLEMPVIPGGSARRECLDLIGVSDGAFVIAELKDAGGDSPLFALYEAVKYNRSIDACKNQLAYHENGRTDLPGCELAKFSGPEAVNIIAAPRGYWDDYRRLGCLPNLRSVMSRVAEAAQLKIFAAEFPDEDFEKQRGSAERYTPSILNNAEATWGAVV